MRAAREEHELVGLRKRSAYLAQDDDGEFSGGEALDEQEQEDLLKVLQKESDTVNVIARFVLNALGVMAWLAQALSSRRPFSFLSILSFASVVLALPFVLHFPERLPSPALTPTRALTLLSLVLAIPPLEGYLLKAFDLTTLAPLTVCGLSWFGQTLMAGVDEELRDLERKKYAFKGA